MQADHGPVLAVDVHYSVDDTAYAAGALFESVESTVPDQLVVHVHRHALPYKAGAFYKRELPPLLALLERLPRPPAIVIVDGFVDLGSPEHPGLGRHLYNHLGSKTTVIGVAKNPLRTGDADTQAHAANPYIGSVYRGSSSRALFVTAAGIALSDAIQLVQRMDGHNRIPTMLKLVDRVARDACSEGTAAAH